MAYKLVLDTSISFITVTISLVSVVRDNRVVIESWQLHRYSNHLLILSIGNPKAE